MRIRPQQTLKKEVSFSGVGIHTGKEVEIRFCGAPENTGIVFQRMDLPGHPKIPATASYVQDTSRSTTIGIEKASVQTVEHVLAALHAYQIDNLIVQVNAGEPPAGDGSSKPFVEMIESAGIEELGADRQVLSLEKPLYFSENETHLIALPAEGFRVSYTLHYPESLVIRSQYFSSPVTPALFKEGIAMCRTFALYEEITALMDLGLIRGGSLDNAIVIKGEEILCKEGLRFPDEMARHKALDLIGDLALVGFPFEAHIIAIRAGHRANVALAKEIMNHFASQ